MIGQQSIAAATAIIGYDLCRDTAWQESNRNRRLVAVGLSGSAASLDTKVRLMVGTQMVGEMFNSKTGAPNKDDMFRVGSIVPGGAPVHALVDDAPVTNPINIALDFEDL